MRFLTRPSARVRFRTLGERRFPESGFVRSSSALTASNLLMMRSPLRSALPSTSAYTSSALKTLPILSPLMLILPGWTGL